MILVHGDTPLHDDPAFWSLFAIGSPVAIASFALYWFTHRDR